MNNLFVVIVSRETIHMYEKGASLKCQEMP